MPTAPTAAPAPEWTRRKVPNLLLSLGVGLLAVAAVIFLVVSWSVLGIGGRAAVMTGCTVLAGGGAALASRRGLGSTAEAVSLLTVGLGLLDAFGARVRGSPASTRSTGSSTGPGRSRSSPRSARPPPSSYPRAPCASPPRCWASCPCRCSPPTSPTAPATRRRSPPPGSPSPRWLPSGWPRTGPRPTRLRDARTVVVAGGGGLAWLVACLAALVAAYGEAGSVVPGTALLLVLAVVAACAVLAKATGCRPSPPPA